MVADRTAAGREAITPVSPTGKKVALAGLWLLRLTLSGAFLYAAASKIRDPHLFSESIAAFRLLPSALVNPTALMLPPLEILAGILALGNGWPRRVGAFGLLTMLSVFLVALASAQARGLNIDCGCFGADELDALTPTKNLRVAIIRDAVLGTIALVGYLAARGRR